MRIMMDAAGLDARSLPAGVLPTLAIDDLAEMPQASCSLSSFLSLAHARHVVLDASALIRERDRERKKGLILTVLKETDALVLHGDFAVSAWLAQENCTNRGIEMMTTLQSSRADLLARAHGQAALGVSLDLTRAGLAEIAGLPVPLALDLFGYRPYLVTPRHSVSIMNETDGGKRALRGELLPEGHVTPLKIEETAPGTIIASDVPFAVRREDVASLSPAFGRIRGWGLSPDVRLAVMEAYRKGQDAHDVPFALRGPIRIAFANAIDVMEASS